jgi:hypothetical protein
MMKPLQIFCSVLVLVFFSQAQAADERHDALVKAYHIVSDKARQDGSLFPFAIASSADDRMTHVDVFGIVDVPFRDATSALPVARQWCDIALLHVNIKACTYSNNRESETMTLYNVNRHDQPIKEADLLVFAFSIITRQPAYLALSLRADHGPFNTSDHHFQLEFIPMGEGKSLLHLTYSSSHNALGYLAMKGYYATFGRGRHGFSIVGRDHQGNPEYAGSLRGAVERNAVRYFLAVQAYLQSLAVPPGERFEKRHALWYDLSHTYRKQLYSMSKDEYMTRKRSEYRNQLRLQAEAAK